MTTPVILPSYVRTLLDAQRADATREATMTDAVPAHARGPTQSDTPAPALVGTRVRTIFRVAPRAVGPATAQEATGFE